MVRYRGGHIPSDDREQNAVGQVDGQESRRWLGARSIAGPNMSCAVMVVVSPTNTATTKNAPRTESTLWMKGVMKSPVGR